MVLLAALVLAATLAQSNGDGLLGTATLIAPAECRISAKAGANVTVRVDPKDGWAAKGSVAGSLFIVINTMPGTPVYAYDVNFVQGVAVPSDVGTSYRFTFEGPIRRVPESSVRAPAKLTPPPAMPIFAISNEEQGWLLLEVFSADVTRSDNGSAARLSVTDVRQSGHGVYRIAPCTFEP
jgi:hypothetical protein